MPQKIYDQQTSNKMHKPFEITSVCREDIVEKEGFTFAHSLTDSEMQEISEVISNGIMDGFWGDLDIAVEKIKEERGGQNA